MDMFTLNLEIIRKLKRGQMQMKCFTALAVNIIDMN